MRMCCAEARAEAHPRLVQAGFRAGRLLRGNTGRAGFNSGVMLFRRSKWTKQFLEAVAELGRVPEPELGEVRQLLCTA